MEWNGLIHWTRYRFLRFGLFAFTAPRFLDFIPFTLHYFNSCFVAPFTSCSYRLQLNSHSFNSLAAIPLHFINFIPSLRYIHSIDFSCHSITRIDSDIVTSLQFILHFSSVNSSSYNPCKLILLSSRHLFVHYIPLHSLHRFLADEVTFTITVIISIQFNHTIHSINWNEWGWMDALHFINLLLQYIPAVSLPFINSFRSKHSLHSLISYRFTTFALSSIQFN